jgi:DNA-binding SARP family transcriptional activator/TolB-like protein/Flp pilus assembly protein TadD
VTSEPEHARRQWKQAWKPAWKPTGREVGPKPARFRWLLQTTAARMPRMSRVGRTVESGPELRIALLGSGGVTRNGVPVALPRSRKVRALLAFLALESGPRSRSRLCDLLWKVPNDPRGELRWCLSKLRGVLDDTDRRRVVTRDPDLIALDLSDCVVDAIEVARVVAAGVEQASREQLIALCGLFGGDLLEGMLIDGNPEFSGWLTAQRHRYRMMHVAVLGELAARAPRNSDETFGHLRAWLQLAPFDQRAHERMLEALLQRGRIRDADEHAAATIRAWQEEGLDWSALRAAWQAARSAPLPSAPLELLAGPPAMARVEPPPDAPLEPRRRASIAVMPFIDATSSEQSTGRRLADGLTEDIITRLCKLRVLFVIARGSVYALGERGIGAQEAGRILNVEYVASGSLRNRGGRLSVVVELAETQDARIVWTDELDCPAGDPFLALDAIVDRIVAAIAEEIESAECSRAMLKPPSSLDAWEAYHRGLWHMYRFNGPDNRHAEQFFRSALELDPRFSRAHAGLSFTHFQNAFLSLTGDRDRQIALALETAGQRLAADDRDPAAHWALGRAFWLHGRQDESLRELQRSIELSPNFALGHYTLGFVHSQTGDPRAAIEATDHSRKLSPFDPLQFAMLASRAMAHLRLGELEQAADFALKATERPNAHTHILAIAAESLSLANRTEEARRFVAKIRERTPAYNVENFLSAFRFGRDSEQMFRRGARQIGFDR